jgi:two-component system, LytTR family, sensor kinase
MEFYPGSGLSRADEVTNGVADGTKGEISETGTVKIEKTEPVAARPLSEDLAVALPQTGGSRSRPAILHPAVFIAAFTMFGLLFATQEALNMHRAGYAGRFGVELGAWGTQYFLWGVFWWVAWRFAGTYIRDQRLARIVALGVPASLVICLIEQIIWVLLVPYVPMKWQPTSYWQHVAHTFNEDLAESMAIFWFGLFFIRSIGYYQRLREKESAAAQLETELANAKLSALRMQLNPHFLFNTMNSISSLMRTDVDAADAMLEQLGSLLRMTLERGNVQLIPLHEEIDFVETYLAMQETRYAGRVTRKLWVDPALHDALVPVMFLQPILENAFAHGISRLDRGGELSIEVSKEGERLQARVTNSGKGLRNGHSENGGRGVGLDNIRNRLALHYGGNCAFSIREIDSSHVQVTVSLPLQISTATVEDLARYGA